MFASNGRMKSNTMRRSKTMPAAVVRLVLRTRGLSKQIARIGGFGKGYTSDVLSGRKQPSARFLAALSAALLDSGDVFTTAAVALELGNLLGVAGLQAVVAKYGPVRK